MLRKQEAGQICVREGAILDTPGQVELSSDLGGNGGISSSFCRSAHWQPAHTTTFLTFAALQPSRISPGYFFIQSWYYSEKTGSLNGGLDAFHFPSALFFGAKRQFGHAALIHSIRNTATYSMHLSAACFMPF